MNNIQILFFIILTWIFLIVAGVIVYFFHAIDKELGYPIGYIQILCLALLLTAIVLSVGKDDTQDDNNGGIVIKV